MRETDLEQAAAILRNGGLVALPTETVYGLGASALDARAVARIYEVKGRPATSPLIVHVCSVEMARGLARAWSAEADTLAARFWPGPLTMVVPKREMIPDIVTAGLDTVGLRLPAHEVMREVIRRAGVPVAAPSANRFTELSPTTADHVRAAFGNTLDMILDGGPCEVGIESTVLSLAGPDPVLLRPGMVSLEDLEAALGRQVHMAGKVEGAHPSPGMHHRHYSPRTPVILVRGGKLPAGRGAYLWTRTPAHAEYEQRMPANATAYARQLYEALHAADGLGLEWIAVEMPPETEEWAGVLDRLRRASSPA
ncbi:MAG: threonylcarbamoyl-AMP synthase [Bryobacterales bacterium]|nr:threonylcarbamoyl-AMP synthase [Bryobacterales bacterium]